MTPVKLILPILFSALIVSCGTNPTPEAIHHIPEPIDVPTQVDVNDVAPDPLEDRDLNDDPNATNRADPVALAIPTAKHVPGRPGFVFNPFTQNMVDVEGIPQGTKVRDPQDKNQDHLFMVP